MLTRKLLSNVLYDIFLLLWACYPGWQHGGVPFLPLYRDGAFQPIGQNFRQSGGFCREPFRTEQGWVLSQPDPAYAFIRLWTAKESYVKATGTGIGVALQEITFALTDCSIRSNQKAGFTQLLLPEHVVTICHQAGKGQVLTLCPKEEWICWNWI